MYTHRTATRRNVRLAMERRRLAFRPANERSEIAGGDSLLHKRRAKKQPPQRIKLDSYVCNKNRTISLETTTTTTTSQIGNHGVVRLLTRDANCNDKTRLSTLNRKITEDEMMRFLNTAIPARRQLLVENGSVVQNLWLCPVLDCNKLYKDRLVLDVHIREHFNIQCSKKRLIQGSFNRSSCKKIMEIDECYSETSRIIDDALSSVGITYGSITSVVSDGERRWPCPYGSCAMAFRNSYYVKNHLMMHYNLRPFKCNHDGCNWGFRSLYKLKSHVYAHGFNVGGFHKCPHPGCKRTSMTDTVEKLPDKNHAKGLTWPVEDCPVLNFEVVDLDNRRSPDVIDANLSFHICEENDKDDMPFHLEHIELKESREKSFDCNFQSCMMSFASSSKLSRHLLTHDDDKERKHVCKVCERGFFRSDHLREHFLRRHATHTHCIETGLKHILPQRCSKKCSLLIDDCQLSSGHKVKIKAISEFEDVSDVIQMKEDDNLLPLRSDDRDVSWNTESLQESSAILFPHLLSSDEKQGNPLVCGGLEFEREGPTVGAGLTLDIDGSVTALSELGTDLLGSSGDLLLQELSEGMLYTSEEERSLHASLLNEDSHGS